MKGADGFVIYPVQGSLAVVEFLRRFINQVKPQQRRTLRKIVRDGHPPVDHLLFIAGAGVVFILIGLISNDRNHAILLTRLYQFSQVDESRFRRLSRDAYAHMLKSLRLKITHHQRIKLPDTPFGARPVNVHPHTKLLRIARSGQRRLSRAHRGADEQEERSKRL